MDAEIAALERRRDKTRTVKQGMMQQLLTGQVRLVESEVTKKESEALLPQKTTLKTTPKTTQERILALLKVDPKITQRMLADV